MSAVNQEDLATVVEKLRALGTPFAVVGGCALPFLVDEPYAHAVRPTMDVDVVVQAATRLAYSRLEGKIRSLGFRHAVRAGAPRCRWLVADVTVDIMPTSTDAAEFGSPWFEEALSTVETYELRDGLTVDVIGPSCLLATKLDAFLDRGASDYYGSKDLEDVVALMEGCSRLLDSLQSASAELRQHVSNGIRRLLDMPGFVEAVPAHLSPESPPGTIDRVMAAAREIAGGPSGSSDGRP